MLVDLVDDVVWSEFEGGFVLGIEFYLVNLDFDSHYDMLSKI